MTRIFALALCCASLPAAAQFSLLCPASETPVVNNTTGDADLDRAVSICEGHKVYSTMRYPEGGAPRAFADGWEACHEVMSRWNQSDTARRVIEDRAKQEEEKRFVNAEATKFRQ